MFPQSSHSLIDLLPKVDLPPDSGMEKVTQEEVVFDNLSQYSAVFPRCSFCGNAMSTFDFSKRSTTFVCRVDSAFICLGTTRAKAGAEGFVKVTLVCIFLTDFFYIQRVNFDYSIFIVCFCITGGFQLCCGGLKAPTHFRLPRYSPGDEPGRKR